MRRSGERLNRKRKPPPRRLDAKIYYINAVALSTTTVRERRNIIYGRHDIKWPVDVYTSKDRPAAAAAAARTFRNSRALGRARLAAVRIRNALVRNSSDTFYGMHRTGSRVRSSRGALVAGPGPP